MDMLRRITAKFPTVHGSKQKDAEFFKFQKTLKHGFPSKASCLAYDPKLSLLAVGTKSGHVRVYGAPGVEFGGHLDGKSVQRLLFLNGQGRLIAFCEDQTFHLWEINFHGGFENRASLDHIKECSASGKMKRISCCALKLESNGDATVLIGTESGNVYALDIRTFNVTDHVIYTDAVIQNIPDDYKVSPGAVEALAIHPKDINKLLIGYNRGLIVLWDSWTSTARQTFVAPQQVESLAWLRRGEKFISSHNDGSYIIWSTQGLGDSKPDVVPVLPFGPFPCKPIDKISFKTTDDVDDDYIIWTGGMPRASYGERHTVAVRRKNKEVVFDFNSKVMDFVTIDSPFWTDAGYEEIDAPKALFVLCEEELVAIDLESSEWPQFQLPYLQPLHASPITACIHVTDVGTDVHEKLTKFGHEQQKEKSEKPWPIRGGECNFTPVYPTDLLITGHEDGSVKFWSAGYSTMNLLYTLTSAKLFDGYNDPADFPAAADEDWPAFKKVGCYDPYSDDPRFGIQRLAFDGRDGILLVAGAAGQTSVWKLTEKKTETELQMIVADLASETENFVWKGKERLELRNNGKINFEPGFGPMAILQMNPPAAVTAVALETNWGVAAVGTAHGFAVFDYKVGKAAFKKCLLTPAEMVSGVAHAADGTMSRFKSFKKSLRESFRRRKTRSPKAVSPEPPKIPEEGAVAGETSGEQASASASVTVEKKESPKKEKKSSSPIEDVHGSPLRPVEREVKEKTETQELNSMVRTMYFCQTYILNAATLTPTLWVGTNGGTIIALTLIVEQSAEKREQDGGVQCQLAKEVHLRHRAPVLGLSVVVTGQGYLFSGSSRPHSPAAVPVSPTVDEIKTKEQVTTTSATGETSTTAVTTETTAVVPPAAAGPPPAAAVVAHPTTADHNEHRLLVVSEEQIKAFHLPMLKPIRHKFKLTATEGARIRRVQFVSLRSKTDENKWEPFIVAMTNQGDVHTFDPHHFRRSIHQNAIQPSDINGILSTVLTRHGDGFYLLSSSEWQRFSVSECYAPTISCCLTIPDGDRPPLVAEQIEEAIEDLKLEEKQPEGGGETSVLSGGDDQPSSLNTSALPTDVTLDSIRDYTTQSLSTESHVTDKGTVTITEKVTKTVHSMSGGGGTTVVKEKKIEENYVNGGGKDEDDDVTLAKSKVVQETKTVSSHFTSSTTTTAE